MPHLAEKVSTLPGIMGLLDEIERDGREVVHIDYLGLRDRDREHEWIVISRDRPTLEVQPALVSTTGPTAGSTTITIQHSENVRRVFAGGVR